LLSFKKKIFFFNFAQHITSFVWPPKNISTKKFYKKKKKKNTPTKEHQDNNFLSGRVKEIRSIQL